MTDRFFILWLVLLQWNLFLSQKGTWSSSTTVYWVLSVLKASQFNGFRCLCEFGEYYQNLSHSSCSLRDIMDSVLSLSWIWTSSPDATTFNLFCSKLDNKTHVTCFPGDPSVSVPPADSWDNDTSDGEVNKISSEWLTSTQNHVIIPRPHGPVRWHWKWVFTY